MKLNEKIVGIRSDHGMKFENAKFDEFYNEHGIHHNFSSLITPQQNGVFEWKNQTLVDIARTILVDARTSKSFWVEVVNTACYVINRCLIKSTLEKTPCEILNKRKSKLSHLKVFGCKCFVLNNKKGDPGKFYPKVMKGFL